MAPTTRYALSPPLGVSFNSLQIPSEFALLTDSRYHLPPLWGSGVSRPKNIAVSRSQGALTIEWDDGSHCEYPLAGLRVACPCAECRGGDENMGLPGSPEMLREPLPEGRSAELVSAEVVGNYALQLVWKDGHSYGIYSWEYLRQLCMGAAQES